ENLIFFNSTELKFQLSTSLCTWGKDQCYVECCSVNLTTNITGVKNITNLAQNYTINDQRKTQLVFSMDEKIVTCNITKCNSDEMNTSITTMDLTRLIKAQAMCNTSFPAEIYLKKEKDFIDQQINSTFDGLNIAKNFTNFNMIVFNIRMLIPVCGSVNISAPKWSDQDLPIDVFFPTESSTNDDSHVAVVRYGTAEKFNNNSNTMLMSQIIRVETTGSERKNLTNPLVIIFPVNNTETHLENYKLSCMFYDEKGLKWSDMGSFTNLENLKSNNTVNCSYNHMTPFAVFLVFVDRQQQNLSCRNYSDDRTKNFFIYNSTGLNIEESLTTLLCTWENVQCYVDCSFVNLSTNLMYLNNVPYAVQNYTITPQSIKLVFNISEITCNVTKCIFNEIKALLNSLSSSNNLKDLKKIAKVQQMCESLLTSDSSLKSAYIRAEKKYIEFLVNVPFNGTSKNYDLEEFNMTVVKMDMMNTTDLRLVQISAPKVPNNNLPAEIFLPTEPFQNVSTEQCKVGIVTYPNASQFMNDVSQKITSKVIRIEVNGRVLKDLSSRLVINITLNYSEIIPENYTLSCQFYDEN
ncbi:uncharacterized protein LOC113646696 isoform X1, partial [Tachysurus ichikawai]